MNVLEELEKEQEKLYQALDMINQQIWEDKEAQLEKEIVLIEKLNHHLSETIVQRMANNKVAQQSLQKILAPFVGEQFIKGKSYSNLETANLQLVQLIETHQEQEDLQVSHDKKILTQNKWEHLMPYIESDRYLELLNLLED